MQIYFRGKEKEMMSTIDLKRLESRAFMAYHQDGLYDMFIGTFLIINFIPRILSDAGFSSFASIGILFGVMAAAGVGFIMLRRKITIPRLGMAQFGPHRKIRKRKSMAIMAVSVSLTALVFFLSIAFWNGLLTDFGKILHNHLLLGLFFGLKMLVVFSFVSYFLDFIRGYFIGVILAASVFLYIYTKDPTSMTGGGVILFIIGTIYLIRFLKKNPLPEKIMED